MSGPQKQFEIDAALDKALAVFWRQGFELTSIQDLVVSMGINRASLYDTFGSKTELYKLALQRYIGKAQSEMRAHLLDGDGTASERVMGLFLSLSEIHKNGDRHVGCFLNNSAVELGPHYPEIATQIRAAWTDIELTFRTLFDAAVARHELPTDTHTAALAATINMTLQGISVMAKAGTSEQHLHLIIGTILTIFAHPPKK